MNRAPTAPAAAHRPPTPSADDGFAPRVQVDFLWGETPVDVITLAFGECRRVRLKSGDVFDIDARDVETVTIKGPSHEMVALTFEVPTPVGELVCVAREAAAESTRPGYKSYDGAFPHALLLAAAVQTVVVSALLLHPTHLDDDAGGGLALQELNRYLKAPEGAAPNVGHGVFVAMGRPPEDAERATAAREALGRRTARRAPRTQAPSLESVLAALSRAVNNGTQHGDLKDTVGDLAVSAASSPQLGAGLGGMLRPRQATPTGAGSGEVGAGSKRVKRDLKERIRRLKKKADANEKALKKVAKRRTREIPVGMPTTLEVPRGSVRLDPVVHDHIARTVGKFRNSVRYCYETWGLPTNPTSSGRLVLQLTLQPDGSVSNSRATIDHGLRLVGDCVEKQSRDWYLGDGLVPEPTVLSFPYVLQPSAE